MMRRTGFKRPKFDRQPSPPAKPLKRPVNMARSDDTVRAAPKTAEHRNPQLLAIARGKRCLLRIPGVCTENRETTVACHSNLSIHGKAGARKADDYYSTWGCMACHRWLDQDKRTSYEEKTAAFLRAHARQVVEWQRIVADMVHTPRDRKAAHWALALLVDSPAPDLEVPDQAVVAAQEMDEMAAHAVERKGSKT